MDNKTMIVSQCVLSPAQIRMFISAHELSKSMRYLGSTWMVANIDAGSSRFVSRLFTLKRKDG